MEISLKTLARRSFTASIKSKEKARYGYAALFVMGKQGQKCIEILQYSTAQFGGIGRFTTLPAPITLFSPMVTPGRRLQLPPIQTLFPVSIGRA